MSDEEQAANVRGGLPSHPWLSRSRRHEEAHTGPDEVLVRRSALASLLREVDSGGRWSVALGVRFCGSDGPFSVLGEEMGVDDARRETVAALREIDALLAHLRGHTP